MTFAILVIHAMYLSTDMAMTPRLNSAVVSVMMNLAISLARAISIYENYHFA